MQQVAMSMCVEAEGPVETGTLLFAHAAAHADLYRVLLRTRDHGLLTRALEVGVRGVYDTFEEKPGSVVPLEVAAHHFIHACITLLEWWLERGMPYPPERMGEMFDALIVKPTKAAALQARR